jgi:hypothetical protein
MGSQRDLMIELKRAGIPIGYANRIFEVRRAVSSGEDALSGEKGERGFE